MSYPGIGVMLRQLGGNRETYEAWQATKDRKISAIAIDDKTLSITLEGGDVLKISDEGQSCCEHRYMNTDDDLTKFIGAVLMDVETRDGGNAPAEYDEKEVEFLIVTTSKGAFTVANYNEHNGYYGGFSIELRLEKADDGL